MTSLECKAITKSGERCKRNATEGGYCKQHFDIYNQAISPDVMRNIVSDYIPYDELKDLKNHIQNLKINENRITKERKILKDGGYEITTKIDGKLRKVEKYNKNNVKIQEYSYNKDEKIDGLQFVWWDNGNKQYEWNAKNGLKDGKQLNWYPNGVKKYEYNFINGKEDGPQLSWWDNGNKEYELNYKNGKPSGPQKYYDRDEKL
jgi:antitoxin component YwqK of YwqJK toxin-antitoxin module